MTKQPTLYLGREVEHPAQPFEVSLDAVTQTWVIFGKRGVQAAARRTSDEFMAALGRVA
jgi:hypothetical protein